MHYNSFDTIEEMKASRDNDEWTDYDWLRYFSDRPSDEEGAELDAFVAFVRKSPGRSETWDSSAAPRELLLLSPGHYTNNSSG